MPTIVGNDEVCIHRFGAISRLEIARIGIDMVADRDDGAEWARRLIAAATADMSHDDVAGVLATIRTFAD